MYSLNAKLILTLKQIGLALLYALLAKIVLTYFSANGIVSIIWPSSGLALAALIIGGKRYAWGVMLGAFLANLWAGASPVVATFIAIGNTLEALAGFLLLTRKTHFDPWLQSQRSYLRLLFMAGGVSTLVAAFVGSTTLLFSNTFPKEAFVHNLLYWWMGDSLGIVVITPFILVWRRPPLQWFKVERLPEVGLLFGLALLACQFIFMGWLHELVGTYAKAVLMFLFISLAAVRFGKHGVSLIQLMTATFALFGAVHGVGFFAGDIAKSELTGFWIYINTLSIVGMLLGTYIIEHRRAQDATKKTEESLRFMLETSPIAVRIAADNGHQVIFANNRYARLINATSEQVIGKDPKDYYANPKDYENILEQIDKGNFVTDKLVKLSIPGEEVTWVKASYRPVDFNGESAVLGWFYDVTDLRKAQDALKLSEQLAKNSLNELKYQKFALDNHAIVAVTDVQGKITYANRKFCEISGYSQEELIGQDHAILNSGYHPKGFFKEMYRTVSRGNVWHSEICNRAKDGHFYWVDTTIAPYIGENGKPESYISIRTDITQRVLAEQKSNFLALYDQLTNLPNRRLLMDRLNQALASSARSGKQGALLFIDLDNFKTLNDTLGHDLGDKLLTQVATRLTSCVREEDTVARFGGDEFVVMLEDLSEEPLESASRTETIANKIMTVLNLPYSLGGHTYSISPSVGVTIFTDHEEGIEELLKQADIAMYQAKNAGRNTLRFFDPQMQIDVAARASLEQELQVAIESRQFRLFYQIQVNRSGHPVGAEALIRWFHPTRGLIPPIQFIPLAEETGLINHIGKWVLEEACSQLKIWQLDALTQDLSLSVNVSGKQFRQTDFVDQVKAIVKNAKINPNRLKLEPTESLLLENVDEIIAAMDELKTIGIQFSLDDFGTGYSSLQYLKKLPLHQLKIDQSFVRDIVFDSNDRAIVTTIISMAKNLELDVIAEGVETEQQRQILMENGCTHFQGYLFGKPVPLEELYELLKRL